MWVSARTSSMFSRPNEGRKSQSCSLTNFEWRVIRRTLVLLRNWSVPFIILQTNRLQNIFPTTANYVHRQRACPVRLDASANTAGSIDVDRGWVRVALEFSDHQGRLLLSHSDKSNHSQEFREAFMILDPTRRWPPHGIHARFYLQITRTVKGRAFHLWRPHS